MKIALIIPALINAGPIVYTKYLQESLSLIGIECEIFYFKEKIEIEFNVKKNRIKFFKEYDFSKFDIVHSTGAVPDLYVYVHKKKLERKWVSSAHNLYEIDLRMQYPYLKFITIFLLWSIAIAKVRNLIVSSRQMRNYYQDKFKDKNYYIIPYGLKINDENIEVKKNDYEKLISLKNKYKIIGSVGVLIKRKGYEQLILFLEKNKRYAVVIIGDGNEKQALIQKAKELGVLDRFCLLGYRENSSIYYKYFDIFAMTSYSEGFGLAMIEAMGKGLPIVCTKLEIYTDYMSEDEVNYFDPGDLDGLEAAIFNAFENKVYYENSSLKLFKSRFSSSAMAEKHKIIYENIKNNK